jgi:protein-S-isoprenylcysteine O-methyltransferase Ste14
MPDRDHADILAPAPVLTAVCVVGAWIAQWAMPLELLPRGLGALRVTLSILLFGAFVGLGVVAVRELVRGGSSPNPSSPSRALVTSGIYRWTRNPIYLGDLAFVAGLAVALSSVWYLVATVLLFALLHYGVVRREEHYLARKFGSAYDDYRRQVRRWI